ncbi:MAG: hypothetical protein AB1Z98_36895 [Nannocystaceae bacterium]
MVLVACPGNGPAIPEWLDDEASGTGTTTVHAGTTTTGTDVDGATTTTTDVDETSVDTTGPGDASTDGTTTGKPTDCAGSGMSFSTLTSMDNDLVVNLDVAGLVSCNQNIIFVATGGTVCILDDGEGGYYYVMESIALEDVRPVSCGLANIGLVNLSINSISDGTEVTVPQAGGMMTGNQSIQVFGDLEGTALGMPVGPTPLMDFAGVLPEGDAMFGADDTTVTYADNVTQLATTMPEVAPGIMVTVTLSGLEGSLTFAL